jgi:hypothetical protein
MFIYDNAQLRVAGKLNLYVLENVCVLSSTEL